MDRSNQRGIVARCSRLTQALMLGAVNRGRRYRGRPPALAVIESVQTERGTVYFATDDRLSVGVLASEPAPGDAG